MAALPNGRDFIIGAKKYSIYDECGLCVYCGGTKPSACFCPPPEPDYERAARLDLLGRVEKALWRLHKHAPFDSWEEVHYYDGLRFVISHRTENDGY
jgi:hypothetical protein